jgi:hypothetical protein
MAVLASARGKNAKKVKKKDSNLVVIICPGYRNL